MNGISRLMHSTSSGSTSVASASVFLYINVYTSAANYEPDLSTRWSHYRQLYSSSTMLLGQIQTSSCIAQAVFWTRTDYGSDRASRGGSRGRGFYGARCWTIKPIIHDCSSCCRRGVFRICVFEGNRNDTAAKELLLIFFRNLSVNLRQKSLALYCFSHSFTSFYFQIFRSLLFFLILYASLLFLTVILFSFL